MIFDPLINWFAKKKRDEVDEVIDEEDERPESERREFKNFHETYRVISFALSLGMMYPNFRTTKIRLVCIFAILSTVAPMTYIFFVEVIKCIKRRDFLEIIRHTTVLGPFFGGFLKMFLVIFKEPSGVALIDEINRDYAAYNQASEEYKAIVRVSIKNCLVNSEGLWAVTVISCVLIFPLMATVLNLYSFIFKSEPQKYMIHELNSPFAAEPEGRYESPYFELMYGYMLYCACLYAINFVGYDGFFGLSVNHACLKMTMYCKALQEAMKFPKNEIRQRVVWVIQEQSRTYEFMDKIQDFFNIWLGIVFLATLIQISNLLYTMSSGMGFDLRYTIFLSGVTIHIFLPCHYASKMKNMCAEVSTLFYTCGWERVDDDCIRRMVCFMVARAQIPHDVTAFNMITFDMELFVSILQTSYSMYTLLSS